MELLYLLVEFVVLLVRSRVIALVIALPLSVALILDPESIPACSESNDKAYLRDTKDCSMYYRCFSGRVIPMLRCTAGLVFSTENNNCVRRGSQWDDCTGVILMGFIRNVSTQTPLPGTTTLNSGSSNQGNGSTLTTTASTRTLVSEAGAAMPGTAKIASHSSTELETTTKKSASGDSNTTLITIKDVTTTAQIVSSLSFPKVETNTEITTMNPETSKSHTTFSSNPDTTLASEVETTSSNVEITSMNPKASKLDTTFSINPDTTPATEVETTSPKFSSVEINTMNPETYINYTTLATNPDTTSASEVETTSPNVEITSMNPETLNIDTTLSTNPDTTSASEVETTTPNVEITSMNPETLNIDTTLSNNPDATSAPEKTMPRSSPNKERTTFSAPSVDTTLPTTPNTIMTDVVKTTSQDTSILYNASTVGTADTFSSAQDTSRIYTTRRTDETTTTAADGDKQIYLSSRPIRFEDIGVTQQRNGSVLRIEAQLDAERKPVYELVLQFCNITTSHLLTIYVDDVNDEAPIFPYMESVYILEITEGITEGSTVGAFPAYDRDSDASLLQYEISSDVVGQFLSVGDFGILKIGRRMWIPDLIQRGILQTGTLSFEFGLFVTDGLNNATTLIQATVKAAGELQTNFVEANVTFFELLPVGSPVGNFRDILNLKNTELSVVQLSQLNFFESDALTGNITSKVVFDREERLFYSLLLEVNIGSCSSNNKYTIPNKVSLTLEIFIGDVNDNQPEFTAPEYICNIPENSDVIYGLIVAVSDKDDGESSDVTLGFDNAIPPRFTASKIEASAPYNAFEISLSQDLDYEDLSVLEVNMTASNIGDPPQTSMAKLTLNLIDQNDNSPKFNSSLYRETITPDYPTDSVILTVRATDADQGQNAELTYELLPGSGGKFSLDPLTGDIKRVGDLGPTFVSFEFGVVARDNGFPSRSSKTTVHVTVLGSPVPNDAVSGLKFLQQFYFESVSEQSTMEIIEIQAGYNGSTKPSDNIVFSLGDFFIGTKGNIQIGSKSGIVSFTSKVDYETHDERYFVFQVLASSQNGSSAEVTVFIQLLNGNDEVPVFTEATYTVFFSPFVRQSLLLYVRATDKDRDPAFPDLTYEVVSQTDGFPVLINAKTGLLSVEGAYSGNDVDLNVTVSDGKFKSTSIVKVIVVNALPTYCETPFDISVPEDSPLVPLRYLLGENLTNFDEIVFTGPSDYFSVSEKGYLVLNKPLDYEDESIYQAIMQVLTGTELFICKMTIRVENVNDNPPRCNLPFYRLRVPIDGETALPRTQSQSVTFNDVDPSDQGMTVRTIPAEIADVFDVSETGEIKLIRDRTNDVNPFYQFSIHLTDAGDTSLTSTCLVQIEVEGDGIITFVNTPATVSVSEAQSLNTVILAVQATSINESATLRFSVSDQNYLTINEQTGELIVNRRLDYETDPEFSITVTAVESVGKTIRSMKITVMVEDYNDSPPKFDQTKYLAVINKEIEMGEIIIKVNASDTEDQDRVYYGIEDCGFGLFTIDSSTGEISLARSFEALYFPNVTFVVTATDYGKYPRTSRSLVQITVPNFNPHAPKFVAYRNSNISVFEGRNNTSVIRVSAFDADAGDLVEYRLPKSEYSDYFTINQKGEIRTAKPLDREMMNKTNDRNRRSLRRRKRETPLCRSDEADVIALPVLAIDNGVPRRKDQICLLILVIDVNDIKPTFNVTETTLYLPQNFGVGQFDENPVLATDLDLGVNGEVIYYVTSKSEYFTIQPNTGKIEAKKRCPESCITNEEYEFETLTIYANNKDDVFEMSNSEGQFLTVHVRLECIGKCGLSTTEIITIVLSCALGVVVIILIAVLVTQYKRHKTFKQGADRRNLEKLRKATETTFQTDTEEYDSPHDYSYSRGNRASYLHATPEGSSNGGYVFGVNENSSYYSSGNPREQSDDVFQGNGSNGLTRPQQKRGVPFMKNFSAIPSPDYMMPSLSRNNSQD